MKRQRNFLDTPQGWFEYYQTQGINSGRQSLVVLKNSNDESPTVATRPYKQELCELSKLALEKDRKRAEEAAKYRAEIRDKSKRKTALRKVS